MLVYPAPVLFADPAAALFMDASAAPGAPVPTVCTLPGMTFDDCRSLQTFDYMQLLQAHTQGLTFPGIAADFQPGMALQGTATDFDEPAPGAKSKASQKKRRRGGAQKGRVGKDSVQAFSAVCTPGMDSQAAMPKGGQDSLSATPNETSSAHATLTDCAGDDFAPMFAGWGNPADLCQNLERCNEVIAQLNSHESVSVPVLKWILPATKTLAVSKLGTRVIQKAIEVARGDNQELIIKHLKGSCDEKVSDLYKSPNGNHVVAKLIEALPAAQLGFLLAELKGTAVVVARHQYGCRVFERLIEHCAEEQVAGLVEELLADAEPLCRHQYGNFVMQHVFEHGLQIWKDRITEQIAKVVPVLAKHRTASHVVQCALNHGKEQIQHTIVNALMSGEGEDSLVDVACSRYGSFVVEEMAGIHAYSDKVGKILKDSLPRLAESQYGKRAADRYGLLLPSDAKLNSIA